MVARWDTDPVPGGKATPLHTLAGRQQRAVRGSSARRCRQAAGWRLSRGRRDFAELVPRRTSNRFRRCGWRVRDRRRESQVDEARCGGAGGDGAGLVAGWTTDRVREPGIFFTFGEENFGNVSTSTIFVVDVDGGGKTTRVTTGDWLDVNPVWMPDGRALLLISSRGGGRDRRDDRLDRPPAPRREAAVGIDDRRERGSGHRNSTVQLRADRPAPTGSRSHARRTPRRSTAHQSAGSTPPASPPRAAAAQARR